MSQDTATTITKTKNAFQDAITNLQSAFDAYVEAIGVIVDEASDEARLKQAEYKLGALIDAYLASEEAGQSFMLYNQPTCPQEPHCATLEEYSQYQKAYNLYAKQLATWKQLKETVNHSEELIRAEILKWLPKYVWFKHPNKECWIGIETGTWGGGVTAISVSYKLPERKLEHTTYYP